MVSKYAANIWKAYIYKAFVGLNFVGGVLVPFFMEWGHISFTKIMILQAWFAMWTLIFELPTGVIADRFGRKNSIALGCLINGAAALVYASTPSFYMFMLGEFLWALATTLFSGADEAFVYDSLKATNKESTSKKVFGRLETIVLAGMLISSPIGSVVAHYYGLQAPMFLAGISFFAAFAVTLTFKEPQIFRIKQKPKYMDILKTGLKYFYKHKVLKILAADLIIIAVIARAMIWLFQPMLKQAGIGIAYFGVVHAFFVGGEILIINSYPQLEKLLGSKKRMIFLSSLLAGIGYLIGGLTLFIPAVLLAIFMGGSIGIAREPMFSSYMNKHIPSEERATILSAVSMVRRLAFMISSLILGPMVDWSLNYTLLILGAIAIVFTFMSQVREEHLID